MRPLLGGDALPSALKTRSRKSSIDHAPGASSHVPTSFFMKREEDMDQSLATSAATHNTNKPRDSTYGVQSLADTLESSFGTPASAAGARSSRSGSHGSSASSRRLSDSSRQPPLRSLKRTLSSHVTPPSTNAVAAPPMPSSAIASTPSAVSLHSLKLSDEESAADELASQAITSSGEDEGEEADLEAGLSSTLPQLVMPSIQMPARRPFTTKGKAMGRLKILIAGETGIGKTSLIRSIVQVCEDIVHVGPLTPSSSVLQPPPPPRSKSRRRVSEQHGTSRVTEVHASTKPYPHWWVDTEDSREARRRKSGTDSVLERNITFIDTPGFCRGSGSKEDMTVVVDYVEALLYQTASLPTMEDSDMLSVLSGTGGVAIDAVIYLLPPSKDISDDIDFMHRLSFLTNVIPVIAKCDTLSASETVALKTSLLARLQTSPVKPFLFGKALDDALLAAQGLAVIHPASTSTEPEQYPFSTPTYPHAISSTPGPDNETMEASLLMSPDYVQPLLPSELSALVAQVFDPESIAWLRHSAAKKMLAWRKRTTLPEESFILKRLQQPRSPTVASVGLNGAPTSASANSSVFSAASPSGVLVPRSGSPFYSSTLQSPFLPASPSFAQSELDNPAHFSLARYNASNSIDQQPLSDIRIAKWATDLQRSLRNERDRFEELQRSDRAKWLLERVGEEVSRGSIVASPGGSPRAEWAMVRHAEEKTSDDISNRYGGIVKGLDSRDPLGLCTFGDQIKRNGFVLFKILGGVSVLGAVVVATVRALGVGALGSTQGGWWGWLVGDSE